MTAMPTVSIAAAALALTILCGWLGARPPVLLGAPRLVPWRFLMLLAFVGLIAALVHLVALARGAG